MSEETVVDYVKAQAKRDKQQLKMQCIDAAIRIAEGNAGAAHIVDMAKAIYAFART